MRLPPFRFYWTRSVMSNWSMAIEKEIIVVNDCSKDDTSWWSSNILPTTPRRPLNISARNATQGGRSHSYRHYLCDGRLYPDPGCRFGIWSKEYNILPGANPYGPCGYRVWGPGSWAGSRTGSFSLAYAGNKLLTFISNLYEYERWRMHIPATKLIRTDTLRRIPLREKRFSFDAELNVKDIAHTWG